MEHVYGSGQWREVKRKNKSGDEYVYKMYRVYIGEKKTKDFYGKTKAEAIRKYKAWQLKEGKGDVKSTQTVVDVARDAIEARRQTLKDTTYTFYMAGVRRLEDVVLGKKQIQAVKADELQEYIFNLSNVCAMATIKRQRIVLNITFAYAVELGLIEENPMNKVKLPNKANVVTQEREPVFLTVEQRKRLEAEVASNEKNPRTGKLKYDPVCALCSTFLLHSGLRIGELRALRWKNVDMDSGFIWVRENAPTGSKSVTTVKRESSTRKVPIDKTAREVLDTIEKRGEFIFSTKNGTMITEQNANRTLKKMLKNCGLIDEGIEPTLHDLRHTFASELIAKGADIKTVSEIMGHKGVGITLNVYVHPSKDSYEKVRGLLD